MIVVIMEAVAIAMVDVISASSVSALYPALSMALRAAGTLSPVTLPVTKERYVPPVPSMGVKVIISIIPTVQ